MGGLDDLVDDQEDEVVKDETEGLMDELDIDSVEELEEFQDRLDQLQNGLVHYDKRMEEIENRLDVLEGVISKLMERVSDDEKKEENQWGSNNPSGLDWSEDN